MKHFVTVYVLFNFWMMLGVVMGLKMKKLTSQYQVNLFEYILIVALNDLFLDNFVGCNFGVLI